MKMQRFDLTYFYGPVGKISTKPETYRDMADAGITLAQLNFLTEDNKIALQHCAKYGIRGDVTDPRIYQAIHADSAERDRLIREVCEDYKGYEALNGFDITDEPGSSAFDALGEVVAAFRKYAPEYETVINLFPNYASPAMLGNPTYEDHLADFINRVKPDFISYDHYHFLGRNQPKPELKSTDDERENMIMEAAYTIHDRPGFFENAEAVRNQARKNGLDAMAIVLLTEHGPYRNLTREELAWEAGMCLAYGFRRVSYFTYGLPSDNDPNWTWDNSMVDLDGNRYQHWYDVQAISKWLIPLGTHLFSLDCEKVLHTEKDAAVSHGRIASVSGNGVVGCYSDGSVLLVNKNHSLSGQFTIDAEALERYLPEEDTFVACEKTITLAAGECVLLR